MKTILFPTDFSANALHAFRYAKMIARVHRAKLILLNTYVLPMVAPINAFTSRGQTLGLMDHDLRSTAHEHMKIYTKELDLMNDEYDVLLKNGDAANEIAHYCKKEAIDLIVMGTKGQSNERSFLMGSITSKVIEKVQTPLLAIPESAEIHPFKKLVFATDLIYDLDSVTKEVIRFAKQNQSQLIFLHVKTNEESVNDEIENLRNTLSFYKDQSIEIKEVDAEDVVSGIDAFLEHHQTDLLILNNHTKSLFEKLFHKSISKEMILQANVPLLIFSQEIHPVVFF